MSKAIISHKLVSVLLSTIIAVFGLLVSPRPAKALYDPRTVENNRYGIHVLNEGDLVDAAALVNSSGGDWGYVKLVIQESDRDVEKWQGIFDKMRELHLIPIVRLATTPEGEIWQKPSSDDAAAWAKFLGSLNWVIENQYVIVFNEPNHAKEWGGNINPAEYTQVLRSFRDELKKQNSNFFILNAGFDASAPNSTETMDEQDFLEAMYAVDPQIFAELDGWASHSYPNPNFSGSPWAAGQGTVGTYLWERSELAKLGVSTPLPVFITETGWSSSSLSDSKIADNFVTAFENVWQKYDIVAVVPFILNYQAAPFTNFSWIRGQSSDPDKYTAWYTSVSKLPKQSGQPRQLSSAQVLTGLPTKLVVSSVHLFNLEFVNTGQTIWDSSKGDSIFSKSGGLTTQIPSTPFLVRPRSKLFLPLVVNTPEHAGEYEVQISLANANSTPIPLVTQHIQVISPLKLNFVAKPILVNRALPGDFSLSVLDGDIEVVRFDSVTITEGVGNIPEIHNLVPGKEYKFMLTSPHYATKKAVGNLGSSGNTIRFGLLLPATLDWSWWRQVIRDWF